MIYRITATSEDQEHINSCADPKNTLDCYSNGCDYSRVVVKKPWGYEYLAFQNKEVAIWILYISNGCQTSMHCHPNKKTALTVLSGSAIVETLTTKTKLHYGDALCIDKKVFHTTRSISEGGTLVMETETSIDKKDLIRLKDLYGRTGKGYEGKDHMIEREGEMYYSFHDEGKFYHNIEKNFGECRLTIKQFDHAHNLQRALVREQVDLICILKGSLYNPDNSWELNIGDIIHYYDILQQSQVKPRSEIELLYIKKIIH